MITRHLGGAWKVVPDGTSWPLGHQKNANGARSDLLAVVENGVGGTAWFGYEPSTGFDNTGGDGIPDLPFNTWAVTRIERDDGLCLDDGTGCKLADGAHRVVNRIAYEDGRFDPVEREFRGFYQVTEWTSSKRTSPYQSIVDDRRTRDFVSTEEQSEQNASRMVGITLQGVSELTDRFTLTYGSDIYLDEIQSSRSATDIVSGETEALAARFPNGSTEDSYALYGEAEFVWEKLRLMGGVRLTYIVVDIPEVVDRNPHISQDYLDPTGNLGLEYSLLEGLALVTNAGKGFRAPNVFDFA